MKAVIVDGPGSSFNPDMRQHQDTIALEVAREEEKAYKDSLLRLELPSAQMLNSGGGGGADGTRYNLDEMLMELQHSGDEDNERHDSANDVYDEFDLDDTLDADARRAAAKARRGERVTRSERARRERHALLLRAQEEQRRVKQQRRDLGELRKLQSEIVAEDEERRMRLERKKAAANERAEELPPKLSRFRYDPEASSVLLTEEITGSLRKLPGGSNASGHVLELISTGSTLRLPLSPAIGVATQPIFLRISQAAEGPPTTRPAARWLPEERPMGGAGSRAHIGQV